MDPRRKQHAADDLKATAGDLVADAQRLEEIERLKEGLDPSDPRLRALADESRELTAGMARKADTESELRKVLQQERPN